MMLTRELCKECRTTLDNQGRGSGGIVWGWASSVDDRLWSEGKVFCNRAVTRITITTREIPENCRYRLEQIMAGQELC